MTQSMRARGKPFKPGQDARRSRGRPKGSRSRVREEMLRRIATDAAAKKQILPLEYLLSVVNDRRASRRDRLTAAGIAAVYLHRRPPVAIEGGDASKPLMIATARQLEKMPTKDLEDLMRLTARFSREQLAQEAGVPELAGAVIDNDTGEVIGGLDHDPSAALPTTKPKPKPRFAVK